MKKFKKGDIVIDETRLLYKIKHVLSTTYLVEVLDDPYGTSPEGPYFDHSWCTEDELAYEYLARQQFDKELEELLK